MRTSSTSPRLTGAEPSQSEVAADGVGERVGGSDVVIEQGGQITASGLGRDQVNRGAVEGRGSGVDGAQGAAADPEVTEAGSGGTVADEVAGGPRADALAGDRSGRGHAGEERTRSGRAEVEPGAGGAEGADRISHRAASRGDADHLTLCLLTGLGETDGDAQAVGVDAGCGWTPWPGRVEVARRRRGSARAP